MSAGAPGDACHQWCDPIDLTGQLALARAPAVAQQSHPGFIQSIVSPWQIVRPAEQTARQRYRASKTIGM